MLVHDHRRKQRSGRPKNKSVRPAGMGEMLDNEIIKGRRAGVGEELLGRELVKTGDALIPNLGSGSPP